MQIKKEVTTPVPHTYTYDREIKDVYPSMFGFSIVGVPDESLEIALSLGG